MFAMLTQFTILTQPVASKGVVSEASSPLHLLLTSSSPPPHSQISPSPLPPPGSSLPFHNDGPHRWAHTLLEGSFPCLSSCSFQLLALQLVMPLSGSFVHASGDCCGAHQAWSMPSMPAGENRGAHSTLPLRSIEAVHSAGRRVHSLRHEHGRGQQCVVLSEECAGSWWAGHNLTQGGLLSAAGRARVAEARGGEPPLLRGIL